MRVLGMMVLGFVMASGLRGSAQPEEAAIQSLKDPVATIDDRALDNPGVRFFLLNTTYWTPERFDVRYPSLPEVGRIRLLYLLTKGDPRNFPLQRIWGIMASSTASTAERYVAFCAAGHMDANSDGLLCPPKIGISGEERRRLGKILEYEPVYAAEPLDVDRRAEMVYGFIAALAYREKFDPKDGKRGYSLSQEDLAPRILRFERAAKRRVFQLIEERGFEKEELTESLIALCFMCCDVDDIALGFARRHGVFIFREHPRLTQVVVFIMRERATTEDAKLVTEWLGVVQDPELRGQLERIIRNVESREAYRQMLEAMQGRRAGEK